MALAAMPDESPACDTSTGGHTMLIGAITLFHGTIDAVRVRCDSGQKCAIVWRFGTREVWLDEVNVAGRKRALYEWHKRRPSAAVQAKLARLEGEAAQVIDEAHAEALRWLAMEQERERMNALFDEDDDLLLAAAELGIDLDLDGFEPTTEDERAAYLATLG
jgi:hypothetical protein